VPAPAVGRLPPGAPIEPEDEGGVGGQLALDVAPGQDAAAGQVGSLGVDLGQQPVALGG
jgi:hypothetical protein